MAEGEGMLGPLMIDVEGVALSERERRWIADPRVGGVILFSRNFQHREQLTALVAEIATVKRPKPLIAVDHEGGRVQRFREGFSRIPPMRALGRRYEADAAAALEEAVEMGWLLAAELRAVGVDFSFAPVLDLDRGVSEVIGDRAFHGDPRVVAALGAAVRRGMQAAGMAAVGKHFPGHGAVAPDSHQSLPVDERALEAVEEDIQPFAHLIRNGLEGVMLAHVVYRHADTLPAGFSPYWIKTVLRERFGFQGAVISDDLSMAGAAVMGAMPARVEAALGAGCDLVLVCNDPDAVAAVLRRVRPEADPARGVRLAHLHGRGRLDWGRLTRDPRHARAAALAERLWEWA